MIQQHLQRAYDNAPSITYTGAGSSIVLWGLHVSDIGVIVSCIVAVLGLALQYYVAFRRIRILEHGQAASNTVTAAMAEAQRAQAIKSADNSERIAAVEQQADGG